MKKLFCCLLIVGLFFVTGVTVSAQEETVSTITRSAEIIDSGTCGNNLTWTFYEDGELVIDGTGQMYNFQPYNSPWYDYSGASIRSSKSIDRITLGDGVTDIGDWAFAFCCDITTIDLSGVKRIGIGAFQVCSNITALDLTGIDYIGATAFIGCNRLSDIVLSDITTIGEDAFKRCEGLTALHITNVENIGRNAFNSCENLTSIKLDNVSSIGEKAFNSCVNLTTADFNDVVSIEGQAFEDCVALTSVNFGNVETIGDSAFDGCNFESVVLTDIKSIDDCAFFGCSNLKNVDIYNPINIFDGNQIFAYCHDDVTIRGPKGSTASEYATEYRLNFEPLPVNPAGKCGDDLYWELKPDGELVISGAGAMYNYNSNYNCAPWYECWTDIKKVTIGNDVTSIGANAFYYGFAFEEIKEFVGTPNLTSVNLANVSRIGYDAFDNCTGLTSITIPNTNTYIYVDGSAFDNCQNLTIYGYGTLSGYAESNRIKYINLGTVSPQSCEISLPTFKITINGGVIANDNALYPCIIYNNITYFPMTYSGSRALGLSADFTIENGLVIQKTGSAPYIPTFEQNSTSNPSTGIATTTTGLITVNNKMINNVIEDYPLLMYRDITYFPLTWRFAVEEFGWQYNFSSENGLEISILQ